MGVCADWYIFKNKNSIAPIHKEFALLQQGGLVIGLSLPSLIQTLDHRLKPQRQPFMFEQTH